MQQAVLDVLVVAMILEGVVMHGGLMANAAAISTDVMMAGRGRSPVGDCWFMFGCFCCCRVLG